MPNHEFLDPIPCVVTRVPRTKTNSELRTDLYVYDVVVKESGSQGILTTSLRLAKGQEIVAQFCSFLDAGFYLLQCEPPHLTITQPDGGAKIFYFPKTENET